MQRFQNILFVINELSSPGEAAFKRAVQLAKNNAAQLTVISVNQEIPRTLLNIQKTFLRLQEDKLRALIKQFGDGLKISSKVLLGTPFLEIIREVRSGKYDLVIKPAEGRGGVSNILFGSTDQHLFRKCPCPVWIMKPNQKKKYARILAAVDIDSDVTANAELNKLIIELSSSLAVLEHSELHIVHAWALDYEPYLRSGRASLPEKEVDKMVRETRKEHKEKLLELLNQYDFGGLVVKTHLIKGDAGTVIPNVATKNKIELIVMGTVARTGIPGFFIGNTAEKTLAEVDCSVLTVKPKGFTTPVKA